MAGFLVGLFRCVLLVSVFAAGAGGCSKKAEETLPQPPDPTVRLKKPTDIPKGGNIEVPKG